MTAAAHPARWEVVHDVPTGPIDIEFVACRCRKRVGQRALVTAGVAMIPLPGVDWLTDIGLLVRLLPRINAAFGLSEKQIERLVPDRRVVVYKAISAAGGMLIGRIVTHELVLHLLKLVGVRLTRQQVAKFVPIAGQAISAALTYSALRDVCEKHIQQCMAVCRQLQLPAPASQ